MSPLRFNLAPDHSPSTSIRMHLVNLLDGSPYYPTPSNIIEWEFPPESDQTTYRGMAITSSRIMFVNSYVGGGLPDNVIGWRVVVWNWKTGDLVRLRWSGKPLSADLVASVTRPHRHW